MVYICKDIIGNIKIEIEMAGLKILSMSRLHLELWHTTSNVKRVLFTAKNANQK